MSLLTEQNTSTSTTATTEQNTSQSGQTGSTWHSSLPEDIRENQTLKNFKDVGALAKSYLHAQSLVGKRGVFVPGEKATDEEWGAFYKSMGQPELEKFDINTPQDKQFNAEMVKGFKEMAHKAGLLPKQAQALFDWYHGQEEAQNKSQSEAKLNSVKQELAGLQKEWGEGYNKQIALAKLAVDEVGGPEFKQYLEQSGLGNDVRVIKLMSKVGALLGEDKIRGEGGGHTGQTPAETQRSISDIIGNKDHPYHNPNHPSHRAAVDEVSGYYKKLAGG